MSTNNRPLALAVGALLIAMAVPGGSSAAGSFAAKPTGFLTEAPLAPSAGGGQLSASLPHLRLDITLTEIENVVVAGNGVVSYGYPHTTVKIMSNAADVSIPDAVDPALEFPTPPSDRTWNLADNDVYAASVNPLFVGVIENGCLGAPAMFDLSLDGTIFSQEEDVVLGEVHLGDTVFGSGHYNLEYTVRAIEDDGDISDITFRGHAQSYCTGNPVVAIDLGNSSGSTAGFRATQGVVAADTMTCRPGTSNWCANGFQIACDVQGGALSSEPDGGVTCTYPEYEESSRTRGLTTEPAVFAPSSLTFGQPSTRQTAAWVSLTCNGGSQCDAFAQRCEKRGGGLSTEPDGGTTCTIQDNTCSGCD